MPGSNAAAELYRRELLPRGIYVHDTMRIWNVLFCGVHKCSAVLGRIVLP